MIVVVLALVAAALSAASAAGEHRAASGLARQRPPLRRRLRFVLALLTSPLWLGSWAVDIAAFFAQGAALHLGALSEVQPLMVATLLFALPFAAVDGHRLPSARDWAAAVVLCAGLALVLSTRGAVEDPHVGSVRTVPAVAALAGVVVLLVVASRGRSPAVLGVAAGMLFGVGAALTKLTAAVAADAGLAGLLTSWRGYALAAVSLASFALQQQAYTCGPLPVVMTGVVITDPLTSYLLGIVGFGERLPATGTPLILAAIGMLGLAAGVVMLSRSPLLQLLPGRASRVAVPASARRPPATAPGERSGTGDLERCNLGCATPGILESRRRG